MVFVWLWVPETKGKTLEEIEQAGSAQRRAKTSLSATIANWLRRIALVAPHRSASFQAESSSAAFRWRFQRSSARPERPRLFVRRHAPLGWGRRIPIYRAFAERQFLGFYADFIAHARIRTDVGIFEHSQSGKQQGGFLVAIVPSGKQFGIARLAEKGVGIKVVLLYWVIAVDETFVVAIGYVPCGDRAVQARCDPTSVGTRG